MEQCFVRIVIEESKTEENNILKKRKLNYCFHDPNAPAVSVNYILKILIEANKEEVEQLLQSQNANEDNGEYKYGKRCDIG